MRKTALGPAVIALVSFYGLFLFMDKVPSAMGWWTLPTAGVILLIFGLSTIFAVLELWK